MKFKILIFTCFLSLVLSNSTPRIFGGDDHDIVANQITTLISKLQQKSFSELRDYALSLESYRADGHMILGGLHDYINQYNEQSLIKYIVSVCIEKKELLDEPKFNSVIAQFAPSPVKTIEKTAIDSDFSEAEKKIEEKNLKSSFEELLLIQTRNTLIKWALTCEYHDNLKKQAPLVGELHDYIDSLSDREITDYIMRLVGVYPELGSKQSLNQLAEEYEIQYESKEDNGEIEIEKAAKTLNFLADTEPEGEGGLVDFIFRLSRERLTQYAFTAEKYQYEAIGQHIRGGIVDYIDDLTNKEIAWFVLNIAKQYPELNSKEFLDALVYKYGF